MTRLTTIAIADGVTVTLEGDEGERSMRPIAGCPEPKCKHSINAHGPAGCTVPLETWTGSGWRVSRCGCVAIGKAKEAAKKGWAA
jgi:hypothetical protein